jgi:hypothetical protein
MIFYYALFENPVKQKGLHFLKNILYRVCWPMIRKKYISSMRRQLHTNKILWSMYPPMSVLMAILPLWGFIGLMSTRTNMGWGGDNGPMCDYALPPLTSVLPIRWGKTKTFLPICTKLFYFMVLILLLHICYFYWHTKSETTRWAFFAHIVN